MQKCPHFCHTYFTSGKWIGTYVKAFIIYSLPIIGRGGKLNNRSATKSSFTWVLTHFKKCLALLLCHLCRFYNINTSKVCTSVTNYWKGIKTFTESIERAFLHVFQQIKWMDFRNLELFQFVLSYFSKTHKLWSMIYFQTKHNILWRISSRWCIKVANIALYAKDVWISNYCRWKLNYIHINRT